MVRQGYDKGFVASLLAASGTLGLVIPPSVCMVVYSQNASCSIGDMFLAGFIPGILAELLLAVLSIVVAKRRKYQQVDVGVTNARKPSPSRWTPFAPFDARHHSGRHDERCMHRLRKVQLSLLFIAFCAGQVCLIGK